MAALGLEGLGGRRLAAGDEVDVDAGRTRLMDNPSYDRPAAGDVPPAALDGPDHDLGYLVLPREADQSPGRIVVFYLVPAGTEVGSQLSQPVDRPAVPGRAGVADDDVDYVEFPLDPGCDACCAPQQHVGPRFGGDGRHDALGRLPQDLRLVPPEVLEEFFIRLVGNEPQRQLPQGDQVVSAEEVSQGLGDLFLRVDVAVEHPAAQLLG